MKLINKDSFWITISNVIKLAFGLLLVPIISRHVLPEQLGKIDLLLAYGPFVNQFISMGLTNSSTKFFKENNDINVVKHMQHKIGVRACVLAILFFIIFSFFNDWENNFPIIIILLYSISLFLENISFLPQNQFLNNNEFQKYAITSTISTILRYSFTLLLVVTLNDKLLALSLGLLASTIYLFLINLKHHKELLLSTFQESSLPFDLLTTIKKYSLPLFFLGIVGILYQSSDRILLSYFGENNMVQIGYLGMAQRIVGVLTVSLSGLFTVWGVKSFESYSDTILMKEKEKLIGMMLLVLLFSLASMFLFKPLIVKYLLTKTYSHSFPICVLLIGTFVNNRIREILEKYFLKQGNSKLITLLFISFGFFSIFISAILMYFYNLEVMLIFRLFLAFSHAFVLFYFLNRAKQKINPILMVLNFAFSFVVTFSIKYHLL